MFAYHVAPIDFGWEDLQTVEDAAAKIGELDARAVVTEVRHEVPRIGINEFLESWENAKKMAKQVGWEGDFRHSPGVFWVPTPDGFKHGFAFKQDNNGSTFVISPVKMSWLED
ncbi:hypothetical protein [Janthinobacterium sp.]|uniref:hypothetical protein n=1 Tax=Janthinobacterium sp. TaxID=1871054 RepID=UPI00289E8035|nr:hypothetical protein [Janthinobacterium sp.]